MFMGLGLIITILLVVGLIYLLNDQGQNLNNLFSAPAGNGKSALDMAKERYARGEIDKEEYEQLRHDLSG
jgi:putative membrane protein